MHATILAYMFSLVETNKITANLNPATGAVLNNMVYVQVLIRVVLSTKKTKLLLTKTFVILYIQEFVANLLRTAFPHLTDNQIKITVTGLFNLDQDIPGFKDHLRDFLVQIREFTGEDDSDLYLEEREASLKTAQVFVLVFSDLLIA